MFKQETFERVEGYRYFNFALLHSIGYGHVLDTMRYDRAFLTRPDDLKNLLKAAEDYIPEAVKPQTILLCRYDWKGKTRPSWTHDRLLSNMKYEVIDYPAELIELNAGRIEMKSSKLLNVKSDLTMTAQLPDVLKVMYANRAMPSSEKDAHCIETAFHRAYGNQEITVSLMNFHSYEKTWDLSIIDSAKTTL